MIAGLPFSKLLMSLSQFFVGINWILEGNFKEKWQRLKSNKKALMLIGLYLMLIPGMLYTSNLDAGLKMLRINLPLLIFPLVLGSRPPLEKHWYEAILKLSILSVWLGTVACSIWGLPSWLNAELTDIRKISIFISHIRFALMISLSIMLGAWLLIFKPFEIAKWQRFAIAFMISWMTLFLFVLQSLTGIVILLTVGSGCLVYLAFRKLPIWKTALVGIFGLVVLGIISFLAMKAYDDYFTPNPIYNQELPGQTALGNYYQHDLSVIENGHYVFAFICQAELENAWKKRSSYPLDSADGKGQLTYSTLIRFLNSKGLTKDDAGLRQLSDKEIHYITKGIANVNYTGLWGIKMRFYQLLWELSYLKRGSNNGAGHTVVMKLEFLKNALILIRENPVFGVGIGDVQDTFVQHYKENDSWLSPKWRMTCHNQYLYLGVAAGIPGMLLFICLFFTPIRKENYIPLTLFIAIAAISMIPEDTLTTQEGASFVAFYYAFFLFCRPRSKISASLNSSKSSSSEAAE
jgi:hypothetical protein